MSIASEIARLQAAKVDIMAALVEKGVDATGKNLVDVPGLIDSIEVGPKTVRIGEHDYPYVQIGNLLWITENLYEVLGELKTDCWWYKNNETTSKENKYGIYYNYNALFTKKLINSILPDGWRIPTKSDWQGLFDNFSVDSLRSQSGWEVGGSNSSGLSIVGSGIRQSDGSFFYASNRAAYWAPPKYQDIVFMYTNNSVRFDNWHYQYACTVRLCKDA